MSRTGIPGFEEIKEALQAGDFERFERSFHNWLKLHTLCGDEELLQCSQILGPLPVPLLLKYLHQSTETVEAHVGELIREVEDAQRLASEALDDARKQGKPTDDITVNDVRQSQATTTEVVWDPHWEGRLGSLCRVLNMLRCITWSIKPPAKIYQPGIRI